MHYADKIIHYFISDIEMQLPSISKAVEAEALSSIGVCEWMCPVKQENQS